MLSVWVFDKKTGSLPQGLSLCKLPDIKIGYSTFRLRAFRIVNNSNFYPPKKLKVYSLKSYFLVFPYTGPYVSQAR